MQFFLKFVHLVVGALPVAFLAVALDALHHHAAVPGAVKDGEVAAAGQARPEAPEIVPGLFVRLRGGDGVHVKAPGVQRIGQAADVAALARGIPALIADDEGDALAVDDVVQPGDLFPRNVARHPNDVSLLHLVARMGESEGEIAIVGQKQQTRSVQVQPSHRKHPLCSLRQQITYCGASSVIRHSGDHPHRLVHGIIEFLLYSVDPVAVHIYDISGLHSFIDIK